MYLKFVVIVILVTLVVLSEIKSISKNVSNFTTKGQCLDLYITFKLLNVGNDLMNIISKHQFLSSTQN